MITPKIYGRVEKGKFIADDVRQFRKAFYAFEGKEIYVTVNKKVNSRSSQQNRYYWGVVINMLAEFTGYTPDEMHDALKMLFLKIPGERGLPDRLKSTTELTTVEFENYMEQIRNWAAVELAYYVPLPNEVEVT